MVRILAYKLYNNHHEDDHNNCKLSEQYIEIYVLEMRDIKLLKNEKTNSYHHSEAIHKHLPECSVFTGILCAGGGGNWDLFADGGGSRSHLH